MIKERYCSYEVARLLKEKGFNEECDYYYEHNSDEPQELTFDELNYSPNLYIKAPTHQMACDWLGEVYGIYITIVYGDYPSLNKVFWTPQINSLKGFDLPDDFYEDYDEYGEACEAALKYSLENLV